jgi:hypothetical protein
MSRMAPTRPRVRGSGQHRFGEARVDRRIPRGLRCEATSDQCASSSAIWVFLVSSIVFLVADGSRITVDKPGSPTLTLRDVP